jgi:branched-chain amino acid transport system permease protein
MKKRHAFIALLVLALFAVAPAYFKNYGIHLFTTWLVFIIATMGLNLTVGYAGQKSLGHAAFFGIGAYTLAILLKAGISFWVGLPVGAAICFVVGWPWAFRRCGCKPFIWPLPRWASTPRCGWSCATKSG